MLLLKNVLKDYGKAVDYIGAHGLNATIVRLMGLTKGDFTGDYRETKTGIPDRAKSLPRAVLRISSDFIL